MSFAAWIKRRRWSANMNRVRKFRDSLSFSERQLFDSAIRPRVDGLPMDYPDALYHLEIEDLCRAMNMIYLMRGIPGLEIVP